MATEPHSPACAHPVAWQQSCQDSSIPGVFDPVYRHQHSICPSSSASPGRDSCHRNGRHVHTAYEPDDGTMSWRCRVGHHARKRHARYKRRDRRRHARKRWASRSSSRPAAQMLPLFVQRLSEELVHSQARRTPPSTCHCKSTTPHSSKGVQAAWAMGHSKCLKVHSAGCFRLQASAVPAFKHCLVWTRQCLNHVMMDATACPWLAAAQAQRRCGSLP